MSSPGCHTLADSHPTPSAGTLTVALAGNPNSGKTTLFNALTGLRQKVANYPGVTVEKKTGRCKLPNGLWANIIDLPGTYSLISRSPDEQVAMEVLRGLRGDTPAPDAVIVVVDASNLQRNLYLVSQLIELGRPLVVALNMMDIAERRGLKVSPENLAKELGVPVIPVVGYKRKGIAELKAAVLNAAVAPLPDFDLPAAMKEELLVVGGGLAILDGDSERGMGGSPMSSDQKQDHGRAARATSAADPDDIKPCPPRAWICKGDFDRRIDRYEAIAERLLIGDIASDIKQISEHEPVASLLSGAASRLKAMGIDPMQADVEAHYKWIESVAHRTVKEPADYRAAAGALEYESRARRTLTQKIDAILIHKIWGVLIFAAIMSGLFITIFWLAQPIMDLIHNDGGTGFIDVLGKWVSLRLPEGPIKALVNDGIFNGVGTVVVFVPQIALLFLFLAILEDSGYLARAAFLMDRLLSKVGLHGKSFIPLLSSFACAIPGIMATRTIENRRERLATILVAPFMSCSARLPVYTLLIGAFFSAEAMGFSPVKAIFVKAGIMLACYALGIIAAAGTAWVFKRTLTKGPATSFILELPSYKIPQVSQVARQVLINTKAFLTKAGTTIFCLSVILWAMAYYPRLSQMKSDSIAAPFQEQIDLLTTPKEQASNAARSQPNTIVRNIPTGQIIDHSDNAAIKKERDSTVSGLSVTRDHAVAAAQSEYSFAGRLGHFMEPAIRPLGFDWKMGVGLVSAFAAREMFIGSMGIVYSVGEVEEGQYADLSTAMRNDHYASGPRTGKPVWTPLVAISLLIWFVLAMQCMSTFAVVRRETGGWKWPFFMLAYMNVLAYVACFIVFQIGSRFVS
jgi:ferrous iron transport protein B